MGQTSLLRAKSVVVTVVASGTACLLLFYGRTV
jgi:hypothetical protein